MTSLDQCPLTTARSSSIFGIVVSGGLPRWQLRNLSCTLPSKLGYFESAISERAGIIMTDPSRQYREACLEPHRGGLILTLGILSFVIAGVLTAIPAWVMGSRDLKKMDAGIMDSEGRALTMAGQILGKVCSILTIVVVTIILLAATCSYTLKN